jgi:hypothetical protein
MHSFFVIGLGIGGLRHAPLNFTMKQMPPSHVPAPNPPGSFLLSDFVFKYFSVKDLSFRYENMRLSVQFGCLSPTLRWNLGRAGPIQDAFSPP